MAEAQGQSRQTAVSETWATHETETRETAANEHKHTPQRQHGPGKGRGGIGPPKARGRDQGPGFRAAGRAARGRHARICGTMDLLSCGKCSGGGERGDVGLCEKVWPSQIQPAGRAESRSRYRLQCTSCQGGGEEIGGPEIGARDEAEHLSLGSAVAGLSRGVHNCSDRVVAAGGLAQGATDRQHKAQVHRARRSPGAGVPNQRTPRAPAQVRDTG